MGPVSCIVSCSTLLPWLPHLLPPLMQLLAKCQCSIQALLVVAEQVISCEKGFNWAQAADPAQQLKRIFQALPHISQQLFLQADAAGAAQQQLLFHNCLCGAELRR
jgi:hypothetical protein